MQKGWRKSQPRKARWLTAVWAPSSSFEACEANDKTIATLSCDKTVTGMQQLQLSLTPTIGVREEMRFLLRRAVTSVPQLALFTGQISSPTHGPDCAPSGVVHEENHGGRRPSETRHGPLKQSSPMGYPAADDDHGPCPRWLPDCLQALAAFRRTSSRVNSPRPSAPRLSLKPARLSRFATAVASGQLGFPIPCRHRLNICDVAGSEQERTAGLGVFTS